MPINSIQKPALRQLASELIKKHEQDPAAKVDEKQLDEILAVVGDRFFASSDSLRTRFAAGGLSLEEKVALAKRGLDASEKSDLKALVTNPAIAAMLDGAAAVQLSALAGVQYANTTDGAGATGAAGRVSNMEFTPAQLEAVKEFQSLFKSGKLQGHYDALTGATQNPQLKEKAEALFSALPPMGPSANPEAFVAAGFWAQAPKGIDQLEKSARYLPGRQILVKTSVNGEVFDGNKFLEYKPKDQGGKEAVTYRATISGESGDNFLVKVDGKTEPIEVPKKEVFALNQPHDVESTKSGEHSYRFGYSATADYDDKFMKAKVAEAACEIADIVEKLDFTKVSTGGVIGGFGAKKTSEMQRQAVGRIHDAIDMKYSMPSPPDAGRTSDSNAGRQAMKGVGTCFKQAGVMLAMLAPFQQTLGFDVQAISGGVYRNVRNPGQNPFNTGAHGWLQLTYRPSMELRIIDRTWQQSDHAADRAYSRFGDRYPGAFVRDFSTKPVTDTDVSFSGGLSVATFDRQFGEAGRDGRDNHMSLDT